MDIHLNKDGQQLGSFSEAEVRRRLALGELNGSELAWHKGLPEWRPLSAVLPPPMSTPPPMKPLFEPGPASSSLASPKTSSLAIASLVCSLFGCLLVPAVLAITFGHMSLSRIKKSGGVLGGRGLAIAGLIIGYLMLVLSVTSSLAIPLANQVLNKAKIEQAKTAMWDLELAVNNFYVEFNRFPTSADLSEDVDLPPFDTDAASKMIEMLLGDNPRKVKFVDLPQAMAGIHGLVEGGAATALHDPWGTPYRVIFDSNYDGNLANPDAKNADSKIASAASPSLRKKVIIYSCGPDKKPQTADDVVRWR